MIKRRTKIPKRKFEKLLEHFIAGTTARTAVALIELNRNTVTKWYLLFREIIAEHIEDLSPFDGEVEVDESYFGGTRKGKRGRGAAGKIPVFSFFAPSIATLNLISGV